VARAGEPLEDLMGDNENEKGFESGGQSTISRRKFLKLTGVAAGSLGLAGVLEACATTTTPPPGGTAATGGTVRLALPGDPLMNPIVGNDASAIPFNRTAFSFLTRPDPQDLQPRPDLAESWEHNTDNTAWTFKLRNDVKWSDGKAFSADDVKFSIEAHQNPANNSTLRTTMSVIDKVVIVDPTTVRFELKQPVGPFPTIVSYNAGIVPKHVLEGTDLPKNVEFNTRRPVTTGPFMIDEVVAGDHYSLKANPNYFRGRPKLDGIIFKILNDVNTQVAQLKSGELDMSVIAPSNLSGVEAPNVKVVTAPYIGFYHLSFNYQHPLFADKRVRQALVHAIDRPGIIKTVMLDKAQPGVTPFPPIFKWAFDSSLQPIPFDPNRAKQLLSELGWTPGADGVLQKGGQRFSFTLDADTADPARQQSAVVAQQNFKAIGVDAQLRVRPFAAYVPDLVGKKYDAHVGFWVLPPDPDFTNYYSTGAGFNTINYSNAEVDRLIAEGRASSDVNKRKDAYFRIQRIFLDDVPGAVLFYPQDIQAMNKNLVNVPSLPFREALQYSNEWSLNR
jgi:peptide/nickel transport system substrate-binding protein